MKVAESEDNAEGGNGEDDVVQIPRDVMEVKPDNDKEGKNEKEEDIDSEISGPHESSKSSSSSSSSSSGPSAPKGKTAKAKASKAKAEPKKGAGRGRGRGTELPPPKAEVPKKRLVPLDTSDVKINQNLKARLDQISQDSAIGTSGSASSSGKAPAGKRRKT